MDFELLKAIKQSPNACSVRLIHIHTGMYML